MAARRPGPPPTGNAVRRNKDPHLPQDDWAAIDPSPNDWDYPPIPEWINTSPRTEAVYDFLMRLPQSRTWREGEWFQIWMALPTIERYFSRPGGETLKSIMGLLNAGLNLTQADMARARMKFVEASEEEGPKISQEAAANVARLDDRRRRLLSPEKGAKDGKEA